MGKECGLVSLPHECMVRLHAAAVIISANSGVQGQDSDSLGIEMPPYFGDHIWHITKYRVTIF